MKTEGYAFINFKRSEGYCIYVCVILHIDQIPNGATDDVDRREDSKEINSTMPTPDRTVTIQMQKQGVLMQGGIWKDKLAKAEQNDLR